MPDRKNIASNTRLQSALDRFGLDLRVVEFPTSTRTAADAADAIGCTITQIAKSLIFRGKSSGDPVLVVASGSNQVDEKKIRDHLGEKVSKADANFVWKCTGFAIGGVPPIGHTVTPKVLLDVDLQQYAEIWAAAGTPNAVFRLTPKDLATITAAEWHDIRRDGN